jgi:hypothetical protein
MEFKVKFYSSNSFSISLDGRQLGITALDKARIQHPELLALNLNQFLNASKNDFGWNLGEEEARLSGQFLEENTVVVTCPEGFLNSCTEEALVKDSETSYKYMIRIDKAKAFKKWKKLGFPLVIKKES